MKKHKALTECPECGSDNLRTCWTAEQKLRQECCGGSCSEYCNWVGAPYLAPKKPIETTKSSSMLSGCWEYELYDDRGYVRVYSEGFDSKAECKKAAKKSIEDWSCKAYGKCVAVIYPPYIKVKGIVIK